MTVHTDDLAQALASVTQAHPRLFGSRERLRTLARERPDAYRRTLAVARDRVITTATGVERGAQITPYGKMVSLALVSAIEDDRALGRQAIELAIDRFIALPVKTGHDVFGADVGMCAIVYDLCHPHWTEAERQRFFAYMNESHLRNIYEEVSPFHNGWWAYKNWGLGVGWLATMHENPSAEEFYTSLDRDIRERASPALELCGRGGGFAEGFYLNYWLYHWLVFCETARTCAGIDYHALVPSFYQKAAVANMFEMLPGIRERGSRRAMGVGDARGRSFNNDRDQALNARRILASRYRDDTAHQAVHAFNLSTPLSGGDENAYMDLLWDDRSIPTGDLAAFTLSHLSSGPGHAYARSSWGEDATWFFFKCGKRFTSHQHLDVGHFYIFRDHELAGEGGHFWDWNSEHEVNYYIRTIAHNSMLIHDWAERWPAGIRAQPAQGANDGGQAYPWVGSAFGHNGAAYDADHWHRNRELGDIAELLAFADAGSHVYVAGDCTRAYSRHKLSWFTRQIVYLRPGTFVIFDRVRATSQVFKKTWLLHAMKPPVERDGKLVITNGGGRLFVQTVLPERTTRELFQGDRLYTYNDMKFPCAPHMFAAPEAECRIEISPREPAEEHCFLHVLTATDASVDTVPTAQPLIRADEIVVRIAETTLSFPTGQVGGWIELSGRRTQFPTSLPG
ncbi:MAG: hypothetical protein H0V44_09025 [Planctomycetes bacterium]|nr:hypothetical protein [Planctomycetota bacterium]